jgi:hypothetical protein
MEVRKQNKRGHRRAASCYDFHFEELGIKPSATKREEEPSEQVPLESIANMSMFEYFCRPRASHLEETSVIVESLEEEANQRSRKELGLKFSKIKILGERSQNIPEENQDLLESPKAHRMHDRIQKIQYKYNGDLQKIEEEMNEMSLANSRNSLYMKQSSRSNLMKIVRASGSGTKELRDSIGESMKAFEEAGRRAGGETVILEQFDVSGFNKKAPRVEGEVMVELYAAQEKENKKPNNWPVSPLDLTNIYKGSSGKVQVVPMTVGGITQKLASQSKNYFLANNFVKNSKNKTLAADDSSVIEKERSSHLSNNSQLIEKGNSLIQRVKTESESRKYLKNTLQRLSNERNKASEFKSLLLKSHSKNLAKQAPLNVSRATHEAVAKKNESAHSRSHSKGVKTSTVMQLLKEHQLQPDYKSRTCKSQGIKRRNKSQSSNDTRLAQGHQANKSYLEARKTVQNPKCVPKAQVSQPRDREEGYKVQEEKTIWLQLKLEQVVKEQGETLKMLHNLQEENSRLKRELNAVTTVHRSNLDALGSLESRLRIR